MEDIYEEFQSGNKLQIGVELTIEEKVIEQIKQRAKTGLNKYGVTMEREDLTLIDWVQHAQEEALDLAVYLEKIKQELKA